MKKPNQPNGIKVTQNNGNALMSWVTEKLGKIAFSAQRMSGDASFRHYYRLNLTQPFTDGNGNQHNSLLAVNSPAEWVNNLGFIKVSELLNKNQVRVPQQFFSHIEKGFFLIEDLGSSLYFSQLKQSPNSANQHYKDAIKALLKIQQIPTEDYQFLPNYDAQFLQFEMSLFRDWFIDRHLNLALDAEHQQTIEQTFELITLSALEQPQTIVHRDYHSRNLMIVKHNNPAVIDFQDAILGPITYDLVSLLKDCYLVWPKKQVEDWCREYWQQAIDKNLLMCSFEHFFKLFEWMGIQRHIKVLGIFCRLNYRDKKPEYLNYLQNTFNYLIDAVSRYDELTPFYELLNDHIAPKLNAN